MESGIIICTLAGAPGLRCASSRLLAVIRRKVQRWITMDAIRRGHKACQLLPYETCWLKQPMRKPEFFSRRTGSSPESHRLAWPRNKVRRTGSTPTPELCPKSGGSLFGQHEMALFPSSFLLGNVGISWFSPRFKTVGPFPFIRNIGRDDGQVILLVSADNMNRATGFAPTSQQARTTYRTAPRRHCRPAS